jgi:hypothetical protein
MKRTVTPILLALCIALALGEADSGGSVHSHQQAQQQSYLWGDLEPGGDRTITYWPCETGYPTEWVTGVENWDVKFPTWAFNTQSEGNCSNPASGKTILMWENPYYCEDVDPQTGQPVYACWRVPNGGSSCSTADDHCHLWHARILFDQPRFNTLSTSWKTALSAHEWGHTLDLADHKEGNMCSLATIMGRLGSNLGGTACMTGPQPGDVGSVRCNAYGYCGDFSGDSCTDILLRRLDAQYTLRLYEGNCASGWGATNVQIGTGWQPFTWILRPGDFDSRSGDTQSRGCTDVIARTSGGDLRLYKGKCSGSSPWWSGVAPNPTTIGTGWQNFSWLLGMGDFDGDGCADVIARSGSQLLLYGGNCQYWWVTFGTVVGSGFASSVWTWLLAPGDFDGDGCVDLIGRQTNGTLWLYTGNCGIGGVWWKDGDGEQIGSSWGQFDWIFSPGDFSGDGKMDIMARGGNGVLYMYKGDGNGGWISDGPGPGGSWPVGMGWFGEPGEYINWIDSGPAS